MICDATNEDDTLEENILEALLSKHPYLEDGSEHEDSDSDVIHVAAQQSIQACSSISLSR